MDLIIKEMFEETGMRLREILVRKIGNKRMPSRNSPSNVAGKTVNTMLYEYIVVMQKRELEGALEGSLLAAFTNLSAF